MKQDQLFREENRTIYLGLVLYRYFNNFDKRLYSRIKKFLTNQMNDKNTGKLGIRELIHSIFKENFQIEKDMAYLLKDEGIKNKLTASFIDIYKTLSIIQANDFKGSYFEMLQKARNFVIKEKKIGDTLFKLKIRGWVETTGFIAKFRFLNQGKLLLLVELLKQIRKEGKIINKDIHNSVEREYLLALKIYKLFKPLTLEQYEDITKHFYVFKMESKESRCYYDFKSKRVYVDGLKI